MKASTKEAKLDENLIFGTSSKFTGFRASGLSAYNNVDPYTIIRELLQNSLDAAMHAQRDIVKVVFDLEQVNSSNIPELSSYKTHLDCSIKTQKKRNNLEQSREIVRTMKNTLDNDRMKVLWVYDNGNGLNDERMEHLLGDGQSAKNDTSSAGSYGNGHMTTFPASNLRYVLYAGVHEQGQTVSGHAILATHKYNDKLCGEDGYLVKKFNQDSLFNRYEFYDGRSIPILKQKINYIKNKYGSGSAIGILGFNHFNKFDNDKDVLDEIATVAAMHFTPIIYKAKMEIELRVNNNIYRLINNLTLEDILEKIKDRKKRIRNSIGPSGTQVWDIYLTLNPTYKKKIDTSLGTVTIHFRELQPQNGGSTHLQLFRNGMWITNELPKNRSSRFKNKIPFNVVCLLDPSEANTVCKLIQDFEGPKHIDINLNRQGKGRPSRKKIEDFFNELHDGISKCANDINDQTYDTGFFSIELLGDGKKQTSKKSGVGNPERLPRNPSTNFIQGTHKNQNKRKKSIKRNGYRIDTKVAVVRKDKGLSISLMPLEDAKNSELRVLLTSGSDNTCDNPFPDDFLQIQKGAMVNGVELAAADFLIDNDNKPLGAVIGTVSKDLELDIWLPGSLPEFGLIQVELIRRKQKIEC